MADGSSRMGSSRIDERVGMLTAEVFYVACAITSHYAVKGNNYFLMLQCRNWLHGRAQWAEDMGCLSVQQK